MIDLGILNKIGEIFPLAPYSTVVTRKHQTLVGYKLSSLKMTTTDSLRDAGDSHHSTPFFTGLALDCQSGVVYCRY